MTAYNIFSQFLRCDVYIKPIENLFIIYLFRLFWWRWTRGKEVVRTVVVRRVSKFLWLGFPRKLTCPNKVVIRILLLFLDGTCHRGQRREHRSLPGVMTQVCATTLGDIYSQDWVEIITSQRFLRKYRFKSNFQIKSQKFIFKNSFLQSRN